MRSLKLWFLQSVDNIPMALHDWTRRIYMTRSSLLSAVTAVICLKKWRTLYWSCFFIYSMVCLGLNRRPPKNQSHIRLSELRGQPRTVSLRRCGAESSDTSFDLLNRPRIAARITWDGSPSPKWTMATELFSLTREKHVWSVGHSMASLAICNERGSMATGQVRKKLVIWKWCLTYALKSWLLFMFLSVCFLLLSEIMTCETCVFQNVLFWTKKRVFI